MKLLVTGATGFVGRCFVQTASKRPDLTITAAMRALRPTDLPLAGQFEIGEIKATTDWNAALAGVDVVVHLAGRAHVMRETATDPLEFYREVNVMGSLSLARAAVAAGVKRMIFVSSVKVNGEGTPLGTPPIAQRAYSETDVPAPEDAYGISKHEAEVALRQLASATGLEVVIIRPPLVYGPGVRANMLALMKIVARGLPLPLASVRNRRSLIYVENLADFILRCVDAEAAANETFLISDGTDFSTPELIRRMAEAMGRQARLFPMPVGLLRIGTRLARKEAQAQRLLGTLEINSAKAHDRLGWRPPVNLDQAFRRTMEPLRRRSSLLSARQI